ncbi:carbohydrate sulfotransferase 15 [Patella vulgata]|uniref:carbohydrate sulfotransferase 15 n=1 Tax=Patella vulgata TaxID=6465 RepID=UPI0021805177|nr:carbohydrate sulfotransferase 15 [Patella vulgata]
MKNYKNPCYRVNDKVQCLPYFYLIGVPKAGTSDLFARICHHQDVMPPLKKETQFWPRTRFKGTSYDLYLQYFHEASQKIDSLTNITENGMIYHYAITGTATPSDFWDNDLWHYDMYNTHLDEPAIITPHHLYHINPKSKFIIIFRNPAERLYSDYCYRRHTRPTATSQRFHGNVTRAIKMYTDCFSKYSIRKCVYDRNLARDAVVWIRLGLYNIYMMHWLKVFPRQQFLLLDYDEYRKDRKRSLGRVYKFLELRTPNRKQWEQILQGVAKNTNFRRKKKAGPMLEETRQLLNNFYRNSSTEIAKYFGEDRPKWSKI